jgi:hypothetical protein
LTIFVFFFRFPLVSLFFTMDNLFAVANKMSIASAQISPGLFIYDLVSVAILLFIALSVVFIRPKQSGKKPTKGSATTDTTTEEGPSNGVDEEEEDGVRAVLVPLTTPRRALIRTLLTLAAATYVADAVIGIVRAVLSGVWDRPGPIGLAHYVAGLFAFGGLAILLTVKDLTGATVAWYARRLRVFAVLAVIFELAHLIVVVATGTLNGK